MTGSEHITKLTCL